MWVTFVFVGIGTHTDIAESCNLFLQLSVVFYQSNFDIVVHFANFDE